MNLSQKNSILVLLLIWTFSASAQFIDEQIGQQEPTTKRLVLKTSPSLFLMGQLPISGEYRLSAELVLRETSSIQLGASYVGKSLLLLMASQSDSVNIDDFSLNGFRVQGTYKFYPFGFLKSAPNGFFVAPHISYTQILFRDRNASLKYRDTRVVFFNVAALVGYQFIIKKRFTIEVFQGIGLRHNQLIDPATGKHTVIHKDSDYTPLPGVLKLYFGANFGFNL